MTAVAVEIRPAPPDLSEVLSSPSRPAPLESVPLDPDAVVLEADTDQLMVMCSCSSSSDAPY